MARNIGRYNDPKLAELCGRLLSDFDPAARAALTASLADLARYQPDAVAAQLTRNGSFEFIGVSRALDAAGAGAIPAVINELSDDAARSNADAYLVSVGRASIPALLAACANNDGPARFAAEEALGKLRAREAVARLELDARSGDPQVRQTATIALASIADPSSEQLLGETLHNRSLPGSLRSQAALGLGRIGSISAAKTLWNFANDENADLSAAVIDALTLTGPIALGFRERSLGSNGGKLLAVASGIYGPRADEIIASALRDPDTRVLATRHASSRPRLVPLVGALLKDRTASADGDFAKAAIDALSTTPQGRAVLAQLVKSDPRMPQLTGFIVRAQLLGRG